MPEWAPASTLTVEDGVFERAWGAGGWEAEAGAALSIMNNKVPYMNLPNAGGNCVHAVKLPSGWTRGLLFYEYDYTSSSTTGDIGITEVLWAVNAATSIGSPTATTTVATLPPPGTANRPLTRAIGPSLAIDADHVYIGLALQRDTGDAHTTGARILGGKFFYYPERR